MEARQWMQTYIFLYYEEKASLKQRHALSKKDFLFVL